MPRKFHLAQYTMLPVTHHSTATWKHPRNLQGGWRFNRPEVWQHAARVCERGKFDFFFSADTEGIYSEYQQSYKPAVRYAAQVPCYDVSTLMAWQAAVTTRLGFVFTASVAGMPPYLLARKLATWDHMSNGRAGVNIVTAFHLNAARNLGIADTDYFAHDQRYDRADEYMEVLYRLWDSWEPDAIVMDRARDMFADPDKVHAIDFHGRWFDVAGPLNIDRSPQGKPLIVQAGQSSRGRKFAARHAEAVFSVQYEIDGMKRYHDALKTEMLQLGRDPDTLKVFFGFQPFVGETEEIAQAKLTLHNSLLNPEAGLAMLSGALGYDLSSLDLDAPVDGLEVPGIQGLVDMYRRSSAQTRMTLADIATAHGRSVHVPQVVGTPARIADWMATTMETVGGDGFLLSPAYVPGSIEEFVELVVPELQRRQLVREEYIDGTLRDNLLAF
ncbi:MAG: NtaA/DmoA family FMN-dependent monooxygenase [Gammaproteobacteria bacterium]